MKEGKAIPWEKGEKMAYVSERIINISELELLVEEAYIAISILQKELKKSNPSITRVRELSANALNDILKAKDFEFCVERRNTI